MPDVAAWRLAPDVDVPPPFVQENPIAVVPACTVELLSPRTRVVDRDRKLPLYAASGVEWMWLVDPEAHRIEIFRAVDGAPHPVEVVDATVTRALPPFASVVDVSRWWLPAPPGG